MSYALLVGAGYLVFGAILTVESVGKPRKPITPRVAAGVVLIIAAIATIMTLAALELP